MLVHVGTLFEKLHTIPANVGSTRSAFHVIAALVLLNGRDAVRAVSHVVTFLPFCKLIGTVAASFRFSAGLAVMGSALAGGACRGKAVVAIEDDSRVFSRNTVETVAIGSATVLKLLGMRPYVLCERALEQLVVRAST